MKLVKLYCTDETPIYLNPLTVDAVRMYKEVVYIDTQAGACYMVKGTVTDVVNKLEEAADD